MPVVYKEGEKACLVALKAGSQQAFEQLYHHYKRTIYHNIIRLVHRAEVAEELTHDVFLKVWQLRESVDVDQPFSAFLRRIAANMAIDYYRKAARDRKLLEELIRAATELYDPLGEGMDWAENQLAFESALAHLPPRRKEIFVLCKLEGKSYAEVAQRFGIGVGTVNDHIVKATKSIREILAKHHIECYIVLFSYFCSL